MKTDKPTPEQLDSFLKCLTDKELNELVVTRAHHDNRVPIEFTSYIKGTSCGIDNDGYNLAVAEVARRAERNFEGIGLNPRALELLHTSLKAKDETGRFIELNRLAAGAVERPFSKRDYPVTIGLDGDINPITLLKGKSIPIVTGGRDARPLVWLDDHNKPRKVSSTERFEKFVKDIPIHELFELGDLIVDNPTRRGLGGYRSLALDQSEIVYHTDLPLIYGEIKSRFKQMGVVK